VSTADSSGEQRARVTAHGIGSTRNGLPADRLPSGRYAYGMSRPELRPAVPPPRGRWPWGVRAPSVAQPGAARLGELEEELAARGVIDVEPPASSPPQERKPPGAAVPPSRCGKCRYPVDSIGHRVACGDGAA
jgi:hypothetical protein